MGSSWGLALWRGQERPLVRVQLQWQVKAQGWRGHPEKLSFGTMKRCYERLLVKVPSCGRDPSFGDASTMGWPPRTVAAVEWSPPKLRGQPCVLRGPSQRSDSTLLEEPRSWAYWTLTFTQLVFVSIWSDCDCALVEIRKYLTYLWSYRAHSWEILDFKRETGLSKKRLNF